MKFMLTLMVFREGENQGEIDVLCEFPDALAALRAVAQLSAANSLLYTHRDVKALLKGLPKGALAHLQKGMGEGIVVQIKEVREYRPEIPEELRANPRLMYHLAASQLPRKVPPEGIFEVQYTGQVH